MPADPCAELDRLKALRVDLVSGRARQSVRMGTEEVTYTKADLAALEGEIARLERECAAARGVTVTPRRHAKRMLFR